jgi:hypothetical protein
MRRCIPANNIAWVRHTHACGASTAPQGMRFQWPAHMQLWSVWSHQCTVRSSSLFDGLADDLLLLLRELATLHVSALAIRRPGALLPRPPTLLAICSDAGCMQLSKLCVRLHSIGTASLHASLLHTSVTSTGSARGSGYSGRCRKPTPSPGGSGCAIGIDISGGRLTAGGIGGGATTSICMSSAAVGGGAAAATGAGSISGMPMGGGAAGALAGIGPACMTARCWHLGIYQPRA